MSWGWTGGCLKATPGLMPQIPPANIPVGAFGCKTLSLLGIMATTNPVGGDSQFCFWGIDGFRRRQAQQQSTPKNYFHDFWGLVPEEARSTTQQSTNNYFLGGCTLREQMAVTKSPPQTVHLECRPSPELWGESNATTFTKNLGVQQSTKSIFEGAEHQMSKELWLDVSVKLTDEEMGHHASKEMHGRMNRRRRGSSTAKAMATSAHSLSTSWRVGSSESQLGRIYISLSWGTTAGEGAATSVSCWSPRDGREIRKDTVLEKEKKTVAEKKTSQCRSASCLLIEASTKLFGPGPTILSTLVQIQNSQTQAEPQLDCCWVVDNNFDAPLLEQSAQTDAVSRAARSWAQCNNPPINHFWSRPNAAP